MTAIDVAELLGRTDLFGGLPRAVLAEIAAAMRPEAFEPGQVIFSRAEPGASLYLVTAGRVRLSVTSAEGRELTYRFAEPGDVMGEIAALDEGPRTADAVAVTKVGANAIAASALSKVLDRHPAVLRAALRFVCARLRDTSTQLAEIALYPIERRVARFLVSALQLGRHDMSAVDVPLELGMNQTELALLLGASRPKVNVALGALSQVGAITRKGDAIVCHPQVLLPYARMDGA